jgi:hypothetical protein
MSNISIGVPNLFQSPFNRQRKDKFIMVFSLPEILKEQKANITRSNNRVIPDSLQFSIYGLVVPSMTIPQKEVPFSGQTFKVTSFARPSYENMTVDFMVDNLFNNYWVINKWLNMFNDRRKGNYTSNIADDSGFLDKYSTQISVFGLDEYNNRIIEFKYYGAFPTSLGGIKYSDRDSNELASTFDYSFSQFEPILL